MEVLRETHAACQNAFIYKVITQAKDYQNLKVDTRRVQNNYELKSSTVEFFSHKFLSAPPGFELMAPRFEVQRATMEPKGKGYFRNKILSISMS